MTKLITPSALLRREAQEIWPEISMFDAGQIVYLTEKICSRVSENYQIRQDFELSTAAFLTDMLMQGVLYKD